MDSDPSAKSCRAGGSWVSCRQSLSLSLLEQMRYKRVFLDIR